MEFVDFKQGIRGHKLEIIFPGWQAGENVAFYSPHDDDIVLGAGALVHAVMKNGGHPRIFIFCRGDAGYSSTREKNSIAKVREAESARAYGELDVPTGAITRFDIPDFALMETLIRRPSVLGETVFDRLIAHLRADKISRVVFSSGHNEHADHTAAFLHGIYTSPQAGDPILTDLGPPSPIRSYLAYSVWTDFAPAAEPGGWPADKGVLAGSDEENAVRRALEAFSSQGKIMAGTAAASREARRTEGGFLELHRTVDIRKPVDYAPYQERLKGIRKA